MTRLLTALTIAAALCFAAPPAQAHEGHHHPPKSKKLKKTKEPKKSGDGTRFIVREAAV